MKVYLAGRMTGVEQYNFPAFYQAAKTLKEQGHEVFNPAEVGQDIEYRDALRIDLGWICTHAEAIAFIPGWEYSPGAFVEHALGRALKLEFIYL